MSLKMACCVLRNRPILVSLHTLIINQFARVLLDLDTHCEHRDNLDATHSMPLKSTGIATQAGTYFTYVDLNSHRIAFARVNIASSVVTRFIKLTKLVLRVKIGFQLPESCRERDDQVLLLASVYGSAHWYRYKQYEVLYSNFVCFYDFHRFIYKTSCT